MYFTSGFYFKVKTFPVENPDFDILFCQTVTTLQGIETLGGLLYDFFYRN